MRRKIYDVKQSSEKDCGPACLLSIIRYYKGYVNLEKIKIDAKTSATGTSAYELIKAANKYGLDGVGKKLDKENLLNDLRTYPYIAHTIHKNFEHYVVVYEVIDKNVVLMDPAYGKKTISKEQFYKISTGNILEFYPRNEILIMKKETAIVEMFANIINLEKKLLVKIVMCSAMLTLASIITSFYFKVGIENINNDLQFLKYIVLFFLTFTILKILLTKIKINYQTHLSKNLYIRLFKEFLNHLFFLPSKSIENKSLGEIITRVNDLGNVKNVFSEIIVSVLLDLSLTLIAIPILLYINAKLFVILLCMLILYAITGFVFGKVIYKKIMDNKESESIFNTHLIENITMLKNIKNLNKTKQSLNKIEKSLSKYILSNFLIEIFYNGESNLKYFINEIGYFCINTYGMYLISINELSITDLITFNTLMSFFLEPIRNLINNIPKYNFVRASIYKLNEFMSLEEEKNLEDNLIENYDIKFCDTSFSYNDLDIVLENVNVEIKENEHIFLKGKSGGGKSTLCKLINKSVYATNGYVYLGGHNVKELSQKTILNNIVYVTQKEYLFTDTVKENIMFYNESKLDKFSEICKLCEINQILENKKMGYDSFIEMDANNFSGGEKQRIILARACLNNFNILIIDEALSEVDYDTEIKIIKNLKNYFLNKTIIYISHKDMNQHFDRVISIG